MLQKSPAVLILTATITPPVNCPDLMRSDPVVRLNDYAEALKFYLDVPTHCVNRIILVENSDSDLDPLRLVVKQKRHDMHVEFMSFPGGNLFPPEYGKGYGEMLMLNYALDHSGSLSDDDVIWKATGRLVLSNIASLIAEVRQPYDIYCDLHKSFPLLGLDYFFDPRFYSFTFEGYNKVFRLPPEKLQRAHIEHLYYHAIMGVLDSCRVIPRFGRQPVIRGYAGGLNSDYFSVQKRAQRVVQQIQRSLVPSLWL